MKARRVFASLVLVAVGSLVTGCGAQLSSVDLNAPPRAMAARSVQSVEVFASAPPTRPHVDVREIQASQTPIEAEGPILDQLRIEAAQQGCDAIYVKLGAQRAGRPEHASATCIMYTAPAAPSAPVAATPAPAST